MPGYSSPGGTPSFNPNGDINKQVQELTDYVAELEKTVNFHMNGNLDTANAREFGGWNIGKDALQSKLGTVGLSSLITDDDDIRIWAGSTDVATASFRVYESGKVFTRDLTAEDSEIVGGTITGATIRTAEPGVYPRIELSNTTTILSAESDANSSMMMQALYGIDSTPSLVMSNIFGDAHLTKVDDIVWLRADASSIQLSSFSDIHLDCGSSSAVYVPDWWHLKNGSNMRTLQDELTDLETSIMTQVSALTTRIDANDFTIDNILTSLAGKSSIGHTHTVTTPNHNHGNVANTNSGGGTFNTTA